jgi:hypothetical protein
MNLAFVFAGLVVCLTGLVTYLSAGKAEEAAPARVRCQALRWDDEPPRR